MEESKRIRFIDRPDFGVDVEYTKELIILHLPWVSKFTGKVLKEMLYLLEEYGKFFSTIGFQKLYAAVDTNDIKIKRLLKRLGFKRVGIDNDLDVFEKEI